MQNIAHEIRLKTQLHPRNRHRGLYDFKQLIHHCPALSEFVITTAYGNASIDFSDPVAVKTLNKALLKTFYNIVWDLPEPFLCPAIPSRADYIHCIADLLSASHGGTIPRGKEIRILDIGVGANCIYPLMGHQEYGWSFIGTEIHPEAIAIANEQITKNNLAEFIHIRQQHAPGKIFEGVIGDTTFAISMCNPPFHSSQSASHAGTERKWKNLNKNTTRLNFGGQSHELWCRGGEVGFIKQMIAESPHAHCHWFTTLVSKKEHLPAIYQALKSIKAADVKTIDLGQGQKKSRIVAWTFG